jgi:Tfp pilus assembly protein PilP
MGTGYLDRNAALSRAKSARVVALVLAGVGVTVAVFGLPGLHLPEVAKVEVVEESVAPQVAENEPKKPVIHFTAVAERLAMVNNHPLVPQLEPVTPVEGGIAETTPQAPTEIAKYLGVVSLGAARMALISHDDKQSFVEVGGKIGEHVVREIAEDHIVLEGGADGITINLSPKGENLVTHAGGGVAAPNAFAGNPAAAALAAKRPANAVMNGVPPAPRAAAAKGGTPAARPATPVATPVQPSFSPNFPYSHIMADPQRRQRFAELQTKLRNTGEYKSQTEIDEAAAKATEEEFLGVSGQQKKGEK